jgi:putative membrane protein
MKSTQSSIARRRRTLLAATVAFLASGAFVSAQTGAAGSTSAGSTPKNPSYGTGSDENRSTNKPATDTSSTSSTTSSATAPSSSYNTGSSTYKSGTGSSDINATATTTSSTTDAGAPTGRTATSTDKLSWGDRRFVTKAADSGNDEIALAKLAAEKATSSEVKSFAQKLIDDHQMVASELQTIASQKNVKMDKDGDHDRTYKRLSKKTGNDFDHEFVEHMIDEHEKDIKMFEKAAKDAKDSDVRSFAAKHVDHLREHLSKAQSLRQTIMPTGRDAGVTTRSSSTSYDTSSATAEPSSSTSSTSSSSSTTPSSTSSSEIPRDSSSSSTSSSDKSTDKSSSTTPPPNSR